MSDTIYKKQQVITLCFYAFGLALCLFLMYHVGIILAGGYNNNDFIFSYFWWLIALIILIIIAFFGVIACYFKIQNLV